MKFGTIRFLQSDVLLATQDTDTYPCIMVFAQKQNLNPKPSIYLQELKLLSVPQQQQQQCWVVVTMPLKGLGFKTLNLKPRDLIEGFRYPRPAAVRCSDELCNLTWETPKILQLQIIYWLEMWVFSHCLKMIKTAASKLAATSWTILQQQTHMDGRPPQSSSPSSLSSSFPQYSSYYYIIISSNSSSISIIIIGSGYFFP